MVRRVAVVCLGGVLVCGLLLGVAAGGGGAGGSIVRRELVAADSPCNREEPGLLSYGWPVKPFDRQHPVRGNFGDPRTISGSEQLGGESPASPGSYRFHNGIDIAEPAGTAVYPVVSGTVFVRSSDELVVVTKDDRRFQYWHLLAQVRDGQHVVARHTVLGRIRPELHHVHLTEIDGFRVHNPADPGHLEPYQDHTPPQVVALDIETTDGRPIAPGDLYGRVLIGAVAQDTPPLPVPGAWRGLPVTPALVVWTLTSASHKTIIPTTVVADFRRSEPPNRDFWRVYAPGSYQNFPVFDRHLFWRQPGHYIFNLTPNGLDTTRLPNGTYTITVQASDTCGNLGSLSQPIRIRNGL